MNPYIPQDITIGSNVVFDNSYGFFSPTPDFARLGIRLNNNQKVMFESLVTTLTGDLDVLGCITSPCLTVGSLTATNFTVTTTTTTTTTALSVVNVGPGPALFVKQGPAGLIGTFINNNDTAVLNVTQTGIYALSLSGDANGLFNIPGSPSWDSAYTTVNTYSGIWTAGGNVNLGQIPVLSSTWTDAYTNLVNNSAVYLLSGTDVYLGDIPTLSSNWNSTYTTVNAYSASWNTGLQTLTFDNNNYDLSISSGNTVNLGILKDNLTLLTVTSGNWNDTYNTVNTNSGSWSSVYNNVNSLSEGWSGTQTNVNANSGSWSSVYNNVNANSGLYATRDFTYNTFYPLTGGTISGNVTVLGTISATGFIISNSTLPYQSFNTDGVTTTFTLASAVASINDILVFVSGVYQRKDTYSLTSNFTLVLTSPPPSGTKILEVSYVRPTPLTVFSPGPNTVINSSIADGAVTTSKIANGAVTYDKLSAVYADLPFQTLTANGGTTYTLISAVASKNEINVFISGVYQNKIGFNTPDAFTLQFVEAPPLSSVLEVVYLRSYIVSGTIPVANSVYSTVNTNSANWNNAYNGNLLTTNISAASITVNNSTTGFSNLSSATLLGAISGVTLNATNIVLLVKIGNNNYGLPLFSF